MRPQRRRWCGADRKLATERTTAWCSGRAAACVNLACQEAERRHPYRMMEDSASVAEDAPLLHSALAIADLADRAFRSAPPRADHPSASKTAASFRRIAFNYTDYVFTKLIIDFILMVRAICSSSISFSIEY